METDALFCDGFDAVVGCPTSGLSIFLFLSTLVVIPFPSIISCLDGSAILLPIPMPPRDIPHGPPPTTVPLPLTMGKVVGPLILRGDEDLISLPPGKRRIRVC